MATLLTTTNVPIFTLAAGWNVVDPSTYLDSRVASTNLTTTPAATPTFTVGTSTTILGVAVQLNSVDWGGSGHTITLELYNNTTASVVSSVVVNVISLPGNTSLSPVTTSTGFSWCFFKFSSSVTLATSTNYSIRLYSSVANRISVWRNATANNWSKALVTTSTALPAATDNIIITDSMTGGSGRITVGALYDIYTIPQFGNIYVTNNAFFGVNYNASLKLAGDLRICSQGLFQIMNAVSSIEINCSSIGQYGIYVDGGFFNASGTTKTTNSKLASDIAVGATTSTLISSPTGWTSGDTIVVASTTRTASECETEILSTISGSTITHSATSFAHGGNSTTLVQADISNITKSFKIFATSASFPTFFQITGYSPTVNISNIEFYNVGANTSTQAGIAIITNLRGDISIQNCVIRQSSAPSAMVYGMYISSAADYNTLTISNNCIYNFSNLGLFIQGNSFNFTNINLINVTNNVFIRNGTILLQNEKFNFYNNSITSSNIQALTYLFTIHTGNQLGNFDNNNIYSNNGAGLSLQVFNLNGSNSWTISNNRIWRNNGAGITTSRLCIGVLSNRLVFDILYMFGNLTNHFFFQTTSGNLVFTNSYFWGGSTLVTSTCFPVGQVSANSIQFINCVFGRDHNGNSSPFSTAIYCANANGHNFSATMYNCVTNGTEYSTIEASVGFTTGIVIDNNVGLTSLNHNQVSDSNKQFQYAGIIQTDSTIFRTNSPSIRMLPQMLNLKTFTGLYRVPVKSNSTVTVSVWIRKSSSTGGETLYNGLAPRLMIRSNPLHSLFVDTVAATSTSSSGVWERLTYTSTAITQNSVLEFYVDCDGTVGWVNVDDFSCNKSFSSKGTDYWVNNSGPYTEIENNGLTEISYVFGG